MTEPNGNRVVLDNSARDEPRGATRIGPSDPRKSIRVSVIVRRKNPLRPLELNGRLSREEYLEIYAADPADFDSIRVFAQQRGLSVDEPASSLARRTLVLRGAVDDMQRAFGVTLFDYASASVSAFHGFTGKVSVSAEIAPLIEAVLGLDRRPVAQPNVRISEADTGPGGSKGFTAPEVASLYSFPTGTGRGQTVGILEFGGGFVDSDLQTYFTGLGMSTPKVVTVLVDDATNSPGGKDDSEVALDIEIVGAIAPGAGVAVYFAEGAGEGSFVDALTTAVHDQVNQPSVISISWGGSESLWNPSALMSFDEGCKSAAALGISVIISAGDEGAKNGESTNTVQFPASSPHVLACGGTTISVKSGVITDEKVWNKNKTHATGGGESTSFPVPVWQSASGAQITPHKGKEAVLRGRGLPDVSGNADPDTGYQIYYHGKWHIGGGTSAVAPLWAALISICNELLGSPVGFINPTIYGDHATAFRDITIGNNAVMGSGYDASVAWDGCTGLGSPFGIGVAALLGVLGVGLANAPVGSLELHNSGGFVVDIHALYKSPNAVTWNEQANKHNFPVGQTKTMDLYYRCKTPPIQPGWLVKMKVWVEAGDDHTANETFIFAPDGPTEKYKISGTTLDNSLKYEG